MSATSLPPEVAAFYTEARFKPPGWTGFTQGLSETVGRTPAIAQQAAKFPAEGDFLRLAQSLPQPQPALDLVNDPATYKPAEGHVNLWPPLQSTGKQESFKPPRSNISFGDARIRQRATSYGQQFAAPLPEGAVIRSPLRNDSLRAATGSDLSDQYRFAMQRVSEKRLHDILAHMRERIHGRLSNRSDNAFFLRKFARMYDAEHTLQINLEDSGVATEAAGMQLDDDSLLALFSKYDPKAQGKVAYLEVMRDLLDEDSYKLYAAGADAHSRPEFSQTFAPKATGAAATQTRRG